MNTWRPLAAHKEKNPPGDTVVVVRGMIVSNVGGGMVAGIGSGMGHEDSAAPRRLVAGDNAKFIELTGRKEKENNTSRVM